MEPVTTLTVAGISWIATKTMDGVAGGAADRLFMAAVSGIRERLVALAGHPEGNDLARGVRQAQLRALERLVRDYHAQRPLAWFGTGPDRFAERALEFCQSAVINPVPSLRLPENSLPAFASPDEGSVAAGAAAIEDAVLAELSRALRDTPIPDTFVDYLRHGGRGKPGFVELFGACLAEEIKRDDAFRHVLHTSLLLQNAAGFGDWLGRIEARFDGALTRLESSFADFATEHRAGIEKLLEEIRAEKGVSVEALRSLLEALGEPDVSNSDLLPRLWAKADEYLAFREQLSVLAATIPNAAPAISAGKRLLDAGDLEGARWLYAESETSLDEQYAREKAALLAARAGIDRLELRYLEAAELYAQAERLVAPFDPEAAMDYLCDRAATLAQHGDELGDNGTLTEAIKLWRRAGQSPHVTDLPLLWAMVQHQLGVALTVLGERESRTLHLEEAVTAFRAALTVRTRVRAPDQWAQTQNCLGVVLSILGTREGGTTQLAEAVAAYREALQVTTREKARAWAVLQNNLANALRILGERSGDSGPMYQAVEAYRAALEEIPRDVGTRDWSMVQTNLGNTLQKLGVRDNDVGHLDHAVAAYRAALEVRPRDRVPLLWGLTMHNLGAALLQRALRGTDEEPLWEALAVCRAALEVRTRERAPFHWALTQNTLGNVLVALGELGRDAEMLAQGVEAYHSAAEVFEAAGDVSSTALAHGNLQRAQSLLERARAKEDPAPE